MAARIAMMAMTTSSSINVNPTAPVRISLGAADLPDFFIFSRPIGLRFYFNKGIHHQKMEAHPFPDALPDA
jgi:hypothetical protein